MPNLSDTPANRHIKNILALPQAERDAAVLQLANNSDPDMRMDSLEVGAGVGFSNTASLCIQLCSDPVWYVQCAALEFSYYHGISEVSDIAAHLLQSDQKQNVKTFAALSLMRNGRSDQIERLEQIAETVSGVDHEGVPIKETVRRAIKMIRNRLK